MHPKRRRLKNKLLETLHLHEIIPWAWPQYGDKMGDVLKDPDRWNEVAAVYYVPELTVVISGTFNLTTADSARQDLLRLNMWQYGPERVVAALQAIAKHIETPNAFIPASIDFNGRTYKILPGGKQNV